MKKKFLIGIFIILILFVGVVFVKRFMSRSKINNDLILVEYSYGGGFGTIADTASIIIKIDMEGNGELAVKGDDKAPKESFTIDDEKLEELKNIIKDSDLLLRDAVDEVDYNECLDGRISNLNIYLQGKTYSYRWDSCYDSARLSKVINAIKEIVTEKRIRSFRQDIRKYYD